MQTIARKKPSARICQTVLGQLFKIFADTLEKWWGLAHLIPFHIESTVYNTSIFYSFVSFSQSESRKGNDECDEWSKVEIYFFSRSIQASNPTRAIKYRGLGNHVLSDECFRLIQQISNDRSSSKFQVLGEEEHSERKLLTYRIHFD